FEAAAKSNIDGIIFTFCYAQQHDDNFINRIINIIENHKGKVYFVRLFCTKEELEQRVIAESRKEFEKIKTVERLNDVLNKWDLYSVIPFVESIQIDNTNINPIEVAQIIKESYHL
ncbi:MAG: hypothetical protein AB1489_13265, partial [Acidobacteriota bacterium]